MSGNSIEYDSAVEILLDSAVVLPHLEAFWNFVDGEISEDDYRKDISAHR